MNELESFIVHYHGKFIRAYEQDSVNKLIADKNREIAELQKQVRRHKYKRCLAMAAYCNAKIEEYRANYDADEGFGDEWVYWIKFMRKWMRRWHEFADKFKEACK